MKMQQEIGADTAPEEIKQKMSRFIDQLMDKTG
jgi:hypothetical protein